MSFHVVIPARWASTRLPGKMLADIAGEPLIVRVAQSASQSSADSVVIATDYEDIAKAAKAHGYAAIMTRKDHLTGTDRLAEAAEILQLADDDIVVNVQGDEPLIDPELINDLAESLADETQAVIATAATEIKDPDALNNVNVVKVVRDAASRALYFSRAAIPYVRHQVQGLVALHHIGIYAYRVRFLRTFPRLTPGLLEQTESLEQLRALEHGFKIHVLVTTKPHQSGVDTAADLEAVRSVFSQTKSK